MTGKLTIEKALLRILCAILLLFAGLAHQPVAAQSLPSAGLAIYVLPDGTISALCQPGKDGKPVKPAWRGCEFCRIAAGALLPPPPGDSAAIEPASQIVVFPAVVVTVGRPSHASGAPPRGPPGFFA
jgi:hypothetical protein